MKQEKGCVNASNKQKRMTLNLFLLPQINKSREKELFILFVVYIINVREGLDGTRTTSGIIF